jgi:hypothetical protein
MRTLAAIAVLAVLAAPSLAVAQSERCLRERRGDEINGALVVGGLGGIIGDLATHGRAGPTVLGAVAGAATGYGLGHVFGHCGQNANGYYDEAGRWVPYRATAYGYYGPDGAWVDGPAPGYAGTATAGDPPRVADEDTRAQEQSLGAAVERRMDEGALSQRDARQAMRALQDIGAIDADYRSTDGRLTPDQRRDIQARLAALRARVGVEEAQAQ